ncbi:HAD family hydrolase [Zunongwangia sp. H14]|uniref:HAD family hydrolase n=1 Tax=Zunongwangia sp. H14 TaxID=3240792 RepID=UPI00356785C3
MEKLLIFDLDNTIFPSASIPKEKVRELLNIFAETAACYYSEETTSKILEELKRNSFASVFEKFNVTTEVKEAFASNFRKSTFQLKLESFDDFQLVNKLPHEKVLVSEGFKELQEAKIRALKLETIFSEMHISNTLYASRPSKRDILKEVLHNKKIKPQDMYVIGDKAEAELKAGYQLGMTTIQVAKLNQPRSKFANFYIEDFSALETLLE